MARVAPLNTTFMVSGIIGFLVSFVYIYPQFPSWGFAFGIIFFAMIIASMISMAQAPAEGQLMPKLEQPILKGRQMRIPPPPASLRVKPKRKAARKAKKKSKKKAKPKKAGKKSRKKR